MLRFEPVPSASKVCSPTHCAMEFVTNVSEIKKIMARQKFERRPIACEIFLLTTLPIFIL